MFRFKVYITDYDYYDNDIEKSILEPIGAEVIGLQCKDGKRIADLAKDADAILVQYANITQDTILSLPSLKVIARYGVGMDIVDTTAAKERGIVCTNVVDYCTDEVADHNIALLLMMSRRIPMYVEETRRSKWHWSETEKPIHRFDCMQVGLIGFGRISQNMSKKLIALGFSVVSYDPFVNGSYMESKGVKSMDFRTLLQTSDAVVLQCPYTKETHHMISIDEINMMKSGSIIVNCARGKLIDNNALYDGLVSGHLAAAGLDDIEDEPAKKFNWSADKNPLFKLKNCFITPHVAYYSEESLIDARTFASINVREVLLGNEPPNRVC